MSPLHGAQIRAGYRDEYWVFSCFGGDVNTEMIKDLALGFIVVWGAICVLGGFWMARESRWNPLPPEEPHHH